ncbi:2089_t:CDS:2 [Entrophospora sp. SA101]|nr:2089_t:CDS:2 [Entrophospora sp. SA101]CAJ0841401.1 1070_t:CDS:2 [Entrophospora sp. SA101]
MRGGLICVEKVMEGNMTLLGKFAVLSDYRYNNQKYNPSL